MADNLAPDRRREVMRRVGRKNTPPEIAVRRILHGMGYRFRLHRRDLPGTPDIVLPKYKTVVFVHGCFWHGHEGCRLARRPGSNADFWNAKLDRNIQRDAQAVAALSSLGWRSLIIWQCQIRDADALKKQLQEFLDERNVEHSAKAER